MTSLTGLLGLPVVSRATAEDVGALTAAVIDIDRRQIVAWQVGKGRRSAVVDHAHLSGIGQAAAMLDDETSLREPTTPDEIDTVKGNRILIGARVLSDTGDVIGTVADAEVDTGSGAVSIIRTSGVDVAADRLRGFGSYALVVAAEA